MVAVLRHWISRGGAAGVLRSLSGVASFIRRESAANRMISTVTSSESPSPSPSTWLMASPGEVFGLYKGGDGEELVGSSHGWVALFNRRDNRLSLSDPTGGGGHRIELPPVPVDTNVQGSVWKVVLSSSPRDPDCCAMMAFGPANRLAFCFPHRSSSPHWTPIGNLFLYDNRYFPFILFADVHDDLVYCNSRKLFTSVTPCEFDVRSFFRYEGGMYLLDRRYISSQDPCVSDKSDFVWGDEIYDDLKTYRTDSASARYDWDAHNPGSSSSSSFKLRLNLEDWKEKGGATQVWCRSNMEFIQEQCIQMPHLVYAEQSDKLFLVLRFVMLIDPINGSPLSYIPYCELKGLKGVFPCQTFGFIVMEMNSEGRCTIVDDLDGLTMFLGINNSFAIPASNHFRPNSIYFTDAKRSRMMNGVHDNGIFDYQNKTILPLDGSSFRLIEA